MKKNNIPAKDETFDNWQNNFFQKVFVKFAVWGIPQAAVNALSAAQALWVAAWALAKVKTERNTVQVTEKDEARASYEAVLRPFIQQWIMVNPLITNADREALQVKPREYDHTPVPVPTTTPVIEFNYLSGNKVKIFYKQEVAEPGSTGRGKPAGVGFCELVYKIGGAAPVNPSECTHNKLATRSPFICEFTMAEYGQKVYAYARWINTRGEWGGWGQMIEFIVP